jgi:hypothetical protein
MATKEELEEKEEDCESTEDYVELAKEVVKELSDKDWAGNLMEEAVDWAETTDDFIILAKGSMESFWKIKKNQMNTWSRAKIIV